MPLTELEAQLARFATDDETSPWQEQVSSLDWLLDGFQWWRQRRGGHWEHWIVGVFGPAMGESWHHPAQCSRRRRDARTCRKPGLGWALMRCEDY